MRSAILMSVLLFCGCSASLHQSESPVIPQSTILDKTLARPEYTDAIKQAERDLPNDNWKEKPWRMNESRGDREFNIATNILASIEPKFRHMNVTELVRALKVTPRPSPEDFEGVSGYVYELGNEKIIAEIQSRPKDEWRVLPSLADDKVEVYEGPQGPGDSLASLINWRILHDQQ